jgi:hypothetical protein
LASAEAGADAVRARVIFGSQAAHERLAPEIEVTAAIEGGAGPVKLGTPARMADGRLVMSHPFLEVDADWIRAYADDPEVSIEWETT